MEDHIRNLDTKIQSTETELNALFTKIQKLEEEIATLYHKKLISKKLELAEVTLTGVLKAIFEMEEERRMSKLLPQTKNLIHLFLHSIIRYII